MVGLVGFWVWVLLFLMFIFHVPPFPLRPSLLHFPNIIWEFFSLFFSVLFGLLGLGVFIFIFIFIYFFQIYLAGRWFFLVFFYYLSSFLSFIFFYRELFLSRVRPGVCGLLQHVWEGGG